jgi:hypothetical protein
MKTRSFIFIFLVAILFATSFAAADPNPAAIEMTGYDVTYVVLQTPLTIQSKTHTHATLVRLHGTFPRGTAALMRLWVGTYAVSEYGGAPDGIYFLLFDKATVSKLEGSEFTYTFRSKEPKSLGFAFEPSKFDLTKIKKEADALK